MLGGDGQRGVSEDQRVNPTGFLAGVRRRLRLVLLSDGIARALSIFIVMTAGLAALDRLNDLEWLRWLAGVSVIVLVAATLYRRALRPLSRPMSDRVLARLVERREPACAGRLLTAVEGLPLAERDSAALGSMLTPRLRRRLVQADGAGRALAVMTLLVLGLAGLSWRYADVVTTALQRVYMPWTEVSWTPRPVVSVAVGPRVVAEDAPIEVAIERLSGVPEQVDIVWQTLTDGGDQGERRLDDLVGPWRERLVLAPGDWRVSVRSGAATPADVSVRVVVPPRVLAIDGALHAPAYITAEAEPVTTAAGLAALPGASLDLALTVGHDQRIADSLVTVTYGDTTVPVEVEPAAAGGAASTVRVTVPITNAGDLVVELTDQVADPAGDALVPITGTPVRFPVRLLTDRPPRVRIAGVTANEAVLARAVLVVDVQAADDHGLATVALEASADGGDSETVFDATVPQNATATERQINVVAGDFASVGQELALVGQAHDANNVTGPGIGRSAPLRVRVVAEETLQRELDRTLADIAEMVAQARDRLAAGMDDDAEAVAAARAARPHANRANDQLATVLERWERNQLDAEVAPVLRDSVAALEDQAVTALAAALNESGASAAVRAADAALGQVEGALSQLLASADLARELRSIRDRQAALSEASREVVAGLLTGSLSPDEGQRRLVDLVERQRSLAGRLQRWQQALAAAGDQRYRQAQELAQQTAPASLLDQASVDLAAPGTGQRAIERQAQALTIMEELAELLRGDDTGEDVERALGRLAWDQEQVQARLAAGAPATSERGEQERLRQATERLAAQAEAEGLDEAVQAAMAAAQAAQNDAVDAMERGDQRAAAEAAAAAASQLRAAQRAMTEDANEPDDQAQQDEQEPEDELEALLDRLKLLRDQQAGVAQAVNILHEQLDGADQGPNARLGFRQKAAVRRLADDQEAVALELQLDIIEAVSDQPIVLLALDRVVRAVDRSHRRLARPALGRAAVRLTARALASFEQLLGVVEELSNQQRDRDDDQEQQDGQEAGGPTQPQQRDPDEVPLSARLALLIDQQRRLRDATSARVPVDLAAPQTELADMVNALAALTRPGSRPHLLLNRTWRAMASAGELLDTGPGLVVASEQDVAIAALLQLLDEAQQQGSGSNSSSGSESDQTGGSRERQANGGSQGGREGDAAEGDSQPQDGESGTAAGGNGGEGEPQDGMNGGNGGDGSVTAVTGADEELYMYLPEQARQRLREAAASNPPAGGLRLYLRYLERMEQLDPATSGGWSGDAEVDDGLPPEARAFLEALGNALGAP